MRKLYIYSTKSYYDIRLKAGEIPYLKIGETIQETVEKRVNQQDTTSNPEPLEIKYERELPDEFHDTTIHKYLETRGYFKTREDKDREWFTILLDEAILLINECITGSRRLNSYSMRDEQKCAHNKMVSYFTTTGASKAEFLLAAKMRFGKNFTLLNAVKTLGYKNVLVLTYKPWVFDSLEYDILNHVNFENFKFIRYIDDRKLTRFDSDKTNIIVLSAQLGISETSGNYDEITSIETEDSKEIDAILSENHDALTNISYDMIIVDEYHYGASTDTFKTLLSKLTYSKIVYVSGTAMRDIHAHRFDDEQIYNWTYVDEQCKIENDMPKMKLFALSLDEELVNDIKECYETEEYPTMSKLFAVSQEGRFVHYNQVARFVEQIMGENINDQYASPFTIDGIICPKHLFCILPNNVKSIEAMHELLVTKYSDKFRIILASGNKGIKTQKELLDNIERAKQERKGSITLSCIRFREGVTVPDWDSVVMLDDGGSVVQYFQAIFRCQSKYTDVRSLNECYVFDYSPQRMLRMTYLMTEVQSLTSQLPHKETVRQFLECAPMILRKSRNEFVEVDFKSLINSFFYHNKLVDRGCRAFEYDRNFNDTVIANLDSEYIKKLPTIKSGKPSLSKVLNDNGLGGGKKSKKNNISSDAKGQDKDYETSTDKIKESLSFITGRLPEYMFNTAEDEFCLNDIIKTTSKESSNYFRDLCKTRLEDYKDLINTGIYDRRFIDQLIANYKIEEDEFWKDKTIEAYSQMFCKYFTDDEDIKTSISLAEEMLKKLPCSIWKKCDLKICDYACKDASFLLLAKSKLMEGLKDSIPDAEAREYHIVHKILFAYCRTETQKNFVTRVLWNKGTLDNIIYCKNDILKNIDEDNMKFDVIVMNPPYKDTTHLKFLKKAIDKTSRYVLSVQPCNWLLKQVDSKSRGGKTEESLVADVEKYGAQIYFIDGAQYFSAGLLAELSINLIDKQAVKDSACRIKVYGDLSGSVTTYTTVKEISKYGDDPLIKEFKNKLTDYFADNSHKSIYDVLKATPRMKNHCSNNDLVENKPNKTAYCVNLSAIRGHVNQTTGKKEDDFYTLIPKERLPQKYSDELALYVSFNRKTDAEHFIEYLKSDFVRFSLFLYKNDANIVHTLKYIPMLDFSVRQTDEKLMVDFSIDKDIQNRFQELIPDYYGIRK